MNPCADCTKPTRRANNAKRCHECARKRQLLQIRAWYRENAHRLKRETPKCKACGASLRKRRSA